MSGGGLAWFVLRAVVAVVGGTFICWAVWYTITHDDGVGA